MLCVVWGQDAGASSLRKAPHAVLVNRHHLCVRTCVCCPHSSPTPTHLHTQVIAYNKVDLPDSGDYWDIVKEYLRVSAWCCYCCEGAVGVYRVGRMAAEAARRRSN